MRILLFFILLFFLVSNCHASSANSSKQKDCFVDQGLNPIAVGENANKKVPVDQNNKIALALGGGGIRAAASIGVLRVLQKEGIPIDYIAGCSMGAIIGGLFCAGVSLDDIEEMISEKPFKEAYAPHLILAIINAPAQILFSSLNSHPTSYAGISTGKAFRDFIDQHVPANKKLIENLSPPFVAVATNINDCKSYKFTKGNLADCIFASSAMPPVIKPVQIKDNLYCDGGFSSNVPVFAARESGAQVVIAVSADKVVRAETSEKLKAPGTLASHLTSSLYSVLDQRDCQNADIVIAPDVSNISVFSSNLEKIKIAINAGEKATYKALPDIKKLLAKIDLPNSKNVAVPK